ncbi:MinD/ParA family ATP-binding protein [Fluviispira sanaruensis]|uniref:MinD/ParA family protein n=1 Tax=Fluviispira sanaruensis TaxID=2493639 RepID=A0A4P2VJX6_FLUSA|nr:MinD/ParA family protein [Fluviispira sanaruensis]BBH51930.1 MinD/ParA family protein [Fluviispira sanaruensis]
MFDQASSLREIMKNIEKEGVNKIIQPQFTQKIPTVIAVSGGKGGVGKTLTTANLGLCMARLGMRTLLIDGDFGLANLDVVLNLRPKYTLDDVLCGERHLKEIIMTGPEGVRIIPSSSGVMKVPELDKLQKLVLLDQIEALDEEFDVVIIDTPAGVSKNVQYWTTSAAEIIMVVTPEPTSLADCYASIKILAQVTSENSFKLIVNMAHNDQEAKRIYEKISTLADEYLQVRVEYLGFIPFDESVRASVRERVPYVQRYPFSLASQGLRDISRQIVTQSTVGQLKGTMQFFWRRMIAANNNEVFAYK